MKCCEYCFSDLYIINKIRDNETIGNCDYCESEDVNIIDITNFNR